MKRDWRDVLKGIPLTEFERHPELYEKEPYRTAWRECLDEITRTSKAASERFHALVDPIAPELHAAFDLFKELQPEDAVDYIRAMRSARMRKTQKPKRIRPSPYDAEFQKWILSAAKRLALPPDADDKELARAIREATHTKASARYLAKWIPLNRIEIESCAVKILEKMATRRDVGNGTRNPRRGVSR